MKKEGEMGFPSLTVFKGFAFLVVEYLQLLTLCKVQFPKVYGRKRKLEIRPRL